MKPNIYFALFTGLVAFLYYWSRNTESDDIKSRLVLVHNGTIYLGKGKYSQWLTFDSEIGMIESFGNGSLPEGEWGKIVDLNGSFALPGLHDSHIHLFYTGRLAKSLNLKGVESIKHLQKLLKQYSTQHKFEKNEWIYGFGWEQDSMTENRYPSKEDLDTLEIDNPIVLSRACGHISVLNSKALSLFGMNKDTPDPPGGMIDKHPETGEPTGIVREASHNFVMETIEKNLPFSLSKSYINAALDMCVKLGLTSVHTNDENAWEIYKTIQEEREGGLPLRVFLTPYIHELDSENLPPSGSQIGLLSVDRVKILVDGSLGAETAALREPYVNGKHNHSGILIYTQEELTQLISKANKMNFRVEIHAIGDRAAEVVLNSISLAGVEPSSRPILTHCQILGEDLIQRMSQNDVIANIQPQFVTTDSMWVDKRISEKTKTYSYAWKTLLKNGVHVAGGSDSPIENPNPLIGIHAAMFRPDTNGRTWGSSECLSFEEAVSIYTVGGAFAAKQPLLGFLLPGYEADFIVLDKLIHLNPREYLLNAKVLQVWVKGILKFNQSN
eukprot:TRINITY_DN0_c4_g1_i3.p1 TRINITY_DN0_c4_g1~~TRINITY_DN0_c4_g1_i3.p1  ORF type:complete len:578 (-),score=93.56 TRINITY_DN0_c4_g1_i3:100-1764(-)